MPFRRLQSRIGSATYRLNTVLVGLALVANGGVKPRSLPVTWTEPLTSEKARQITDQAEKFACTAAVVLAADVFDQFLRDIAKEEWLSFGQKARNIATKAKTRTKAEGGDFSVAERAEALLKDLGLPTGPLVAGLELFSKWRNVVVHNSERKPRLEPRFGEMLINSKEHFHKHYAHLDIALAVHNFESRKTPVPKEATSLIAVAQNASRAIDEAAIKRVASTPVSIASSADQILTYYFADPERIRPAWIEISEAWQGSAERRRANFLKIMQCVGLTETNKAVSAPLPGSYVDEIISLDRDGLASRFNISAPAPR